MQSSKLVSAALLGFASVATLAATSAGVSAATVYSDVSPSHWAFSAVQWAAQNGIMTGPGDKPGMFDIAGWVNRAQLVVTLQRHDAMLQKQITDLNSRIDQLDTRLSRLDGGARASSSSSSRYSSSASSMSAVGATFSATLIGDREVPAVNTAGTGFATFTWNGSNNSLNYDITVQGLTSAITDAHFHTGAIGIAGPVVEPITFSGNRAVGTWYNLTEQERADLGAGKIYVNVHTVNNPNGEIRGQVLMTGSSFSSSLSSASSLSSNSSSMSSNSSSSLSSSSMSSSSSSF